MTIDKTLKRKGRRAGSRNVLKRGERIEQMKSEERWNDGRSPLGLPKTRVVKQTFGKKKKKKAEGGDAKAAAPAKGAAPPRQGWWEEVTRQGDASSPRQDDQTGISRLFRSDPARRHPLVKVADRFVAVNSFDRLPSSGATTTLTLGSICLSESGMLFVTTICLIGASPEAEGPGRRRPGAVPIDLLRPVLFDDPDP
ncbi:MAG: small basic protein [Planctomycetales bacterium]